MLQILKIFLTGSLFESRLFRIFSIHFSHIRICLTLRLSVVMLQKGVDWTLFARPLYHMAVSLNIGEPATKMQGVFCNVVILVFFYVLKGWNMKQAFFKVKYIDTCIHILICNYQYKEKLFVKTEPPNNVFLYIYFLSI